MHETANGQWLSAQSRAQHAAPKACARARREARARASFSRSENEGTVRFPKEVA